MRKIFKERREIFIGLDLGIKNKKTTGLCILEKRKDKIYILKIKNIFGKEIFKEIKKYLKNTKVIAIDAPLTTGKGKGGMRLYEKFLSTKIFRKEKVNPLPPALIPKLCTFAKELVKKLEKNGFVLDINLIEVFPNITKKILKQSKIIKNLKIKEVFSFETKDQESAFLCALLALLHSQFKTSYLGYKDGFLFLPEMSFWKKNWIKKFSLAWQEKDRLKYRRLITNLFSI